MKFNNVVAFESLEAKSTINVGVQIADGVNIPVYKTDGSAGADICSSESKVIRKGGIIIVGTGVSMEIPEGYEAQVRSRSGLSSKGIFVLNSPGTIDSDYRGEIRIILANMGEEDFIVEKGFRIAQLVFSRVFVADFTCSNILSSTSRGAGGFGHTGISN